MLPRFTQYYEGAKDGELLPKLQTLLERAGVQTKDITALIDEFVSTRPLSFHACLTTNTLDEDGRKSLFQDYSNIKVALEDRHGHTLELANIREWFQELAVKVWQHIESWG